MVKLRVTASDVRGVVGRVAACSPKRSPKEVLTRLHLSASDGELRVTATDTDVLATASCVADVAESGELLVAADKFAAIVKTALDDISISELKSQIKIKTGSWSTRLGMTDVALWPNIKSTKTRTIATVDGDVLLRSLAAVDDAVDRKMSSNYALTGIGLDVSAGCDLVASDGRAMAWQHVGDDPADFKVTSPYILPMESLRGLRAWVDQDIDDPVVISANDNLLRMKQAGGEFQCRLLEGRFPQWRSVMPSGEFESITVAVCELLSVVNRATVTADYDDMEHGRGVSFEATADRLTVRSSVPEVGDSDCSMGIEGGERDWKISLDYRFLGNALRKFQQDDQVTIEYRGADRTFVMRSGSLVRIIQPLTEDVDR